MSEGKTLRNRFKMKKIDFSEKKSLTKSPLPRWEGIEGRVKKIFAHPLPTSPLKGEGYKQKCWKILDRGGQFFLSLLILTGIFWFGIVLSPAVKLGRATVTDRITNPPPEFHSLPGITWEGRREFRINGGRMSVERGMVGNKYSPNLWSRLKKASGDIVAGGEKEGFLAGLPLERDQALKLLARGLNPSDLVSAFLVLPRKDYGADLFTFSASGLGLNNFLAPGLNDAPGRDPAGLPRLPLSQRLISIQGAGPSPLLEIAVYRYTGSLAEARRSYAERLAREEWEILKEHGGNDSQNYRRGKSLLSLGIIQDPEEGILITAAMLTQ